MDNLKNKRILAIVGLVCMFLGTILPFVTLKILGISSSASLWKYWEGKIVLLLIVVNGLFIFRDYIKKYVPQIFNSGFGKMIENANSKLSIIPTLVAVVFVLYLTFNLNVDGKYIKFGLGFYVLWLGVISLVGHSIFYKGNITEQPVGTQSPVPEQNNNVSMNGSVQPVEVINNTVTQNEQPMVANVSAEQNTNLVQDNSVPMNGSVQPVEVINNPIIQNEQPNTKVCPKCGKEIDSNAKICPICGYTFE